MYISIYKSLWLKEILNMTTEIVTECHVLLIMKSYFSESFPLFLYLTDGRRDCCPERIIHWFVHSANRCTMLIYVGHLQGAEIPRLKRHSLSPPYTNPICKTEPEGCVQPSIPSSGFAIDSAEAFTWVLVSSNLSILPKVHFSHSSFELLSTNSFLPNPDYQKSHKKKNKHNSYSF
jgi:hypothetical protein